VPTLSSPLCNDKAIIENDYRRLLVMTMGKQGYIREVNISDYTYRSLELMQERIIKIRNTFMRVLKGRKHISETQKAFEERTLSDYVSKNIIIPLIDNPNLWGNKEQYLIWHKNSTQAIIYHCPIVWDNGESLTVGMSQKILNLITKDFWALDILPSDYENFLHVVIDKIVLKALGISDPWTKIDDYSDYEEFQLRKYTNRKNRANGTQYSSIETENGIWLEGARSRKLF
jgi:hypothetical protein